MFFWGGEAGRRGRIETSVRPGAYPPCFHPLCPPLPSSSSTHLLTFIFEPLGWRDWCARTLRGEGRGRFLAPSFDVVICSRHRKHMGKLLRVSKNTEIHFFWFPYTIRRVILHKSLCITTDIWVEFLTVCTVVLLAESTTENMQWTFSYNCGILWGSYIMHERLSYNSDTQNSNSNHNVLCLISDSVQKR